MKPQNVLVFLILLLAGVFFVMYPRADVKGYIRVISHEKKVDVQKFWKFREFVAPGDFVFDRNGIDHKVVVDLTQRPLLDPQAFITLQFTSAKVHSIEMLTNKSSIAEVISLPGEVVFQNPDSILTKTAADYYLAYIQTIPEMQKVNGFYKSPGEDEKLLKSYTHSVSVSLIDNK